MFSLFFLKNIPVGISLHEFSPLPLLPAGSTRLATVGVDFGDSTQNVSFDLMASGRPVRVGLRPSVGELIRPVSFSEGFFLNEQGKVCWGHCEIVKLLEK